MLERWAVFISGRGSNLSALINSHHYAKHRVVLVVTNRPHCAGVYKARRAGVPVLEFNGRDWASLNQALRKRGVSRILLAGFMKIIPESFVNLWPSKMLNIHPSLLPSYPGLKSIERAVADGAPVGVTVHEVIAAVDEGKNILQCPVPVEPDFSIEKVKDGVHRCEHRLIRRVLSRWSNAG